MLYVIIPLIILFLIALIVLAIVLLIKEKNRYIAFINENSVALIKLNEINSKYNLLPVKEFSLSYDYDSDVNFDNVSCLDFMIYELQFHGKAIMQNMNNNLKNMMEYKLYEKEVFDIGELGHYKIETEGYKTEKLLKYETYLFTKIVYKKPRPYRLFVKLTYHNMGGRFMDEKERIFEAAEIKTAINNLNQKQGNYYLNKDVWDSICKVERSKVSNRLRFAILERDHKRCRKCGSRYNLEIDHIIPISKGGKSTYDNLQTLCHHCNYLKGNNLE